MQRKYIKIYHYSPRHLNDAVELTDIDPSHYGTGISKNSECKHGKKGLNKSFFYTIDDPQECIDSTYIRYEIYLPYEWKGKIYDMGANGIYHDPKNSSLSA